MTAVSSVQKSFVYLDKVCERTPVLSTVAAIVNILAKGVLITCCSKQTLKNNKYFYHITQKSITRSLILLVPILGNLIIYLHDRKQKPIAQTPPKPFIFIPTTPETEEGMKRRKAATIIQRALRKKLQKVEPTFLKKAESILEPKPLSFTFDEPLQRWNELNKLAEPLRKDHYVFVHTSNPFNAFATDLSTYLDPTRAPSSSSAWPLKRRVRANGIATTYVNFEDFAKDNIGKGVLYQGQRDDVHPYNQHILSCDHIFDNQLGMESAFYFFKTASSISHPDDTFANRFFKHYFSSQSVITFASNLFSHAKNAFTVGYNSGHGRSYLIAIPKKTLEDEKTNYVWRCHAFGKPCTCLGKDHASFVKTLQKDQENASGAKSKCTGTGYYPQYRILTGNLDADQSANVIAIDGLPAKERKIYKDNFWDIAILLKKLQKIEGIDPETSPEQLAFILETTRFKLKDSFLSAGSNHWFQVKSFQTEYTACLKELLKNKTRFLKAEAEYLKFVLSSACQDNLANLGIAL